MKLELFGLYLVLVWKEIVPENLFQHEADCGTTFRG